MPIDAGTAIMLGSFIFTFAFLSVQIDKKHGALQVLFLALSFYTILLATSISVNFAQTGTEGEILPVMLGGYNVFIWTVILVIFYLVIMFFWNIFRKDKKDDD